MLGGGLGGGFCIPDASAGKLAMEPKIDKARGIWEVMISIEWFDSLGVAR